MASVPGPVWCLYSESLLFKMDAVLRVIVNNRISSEWAEKFVLLRKKAKSFRKDWFPIPGSMRNLWTDEWHDNEEWGLSIHLQANHIGKRGTGTYWALSIFYALYRVFLDTLFNFIPGGLISSLISEFSMLCFHRGGKHTHTKSQDLHNMFKFTQSVQVSKFERPKAS